MKVMKSTRYEYENTGMAVFTFIMYSILFTAWIWIVIPYTDPTTFWQRFAMMVVLFSFVLVFIISQTTKTLIRTIEAEADSLKEAEKE